MNLLCDVVLMDSIAMKQGIDRATEVGLKAAGFLLMHLDGSC